MWHSCVTLENDTLMAPVRHPDDTRKPHKPLPYAVAFATCKEERGSGVQQEMQRLNVPVRRCSMKCNDCGVLVCDGVQEAVNSVQLHQNFQREAGWEMPIGLVPCRGSRL